MHSPGPQTIPPETLLLAYRSGIFPMADGREDPEIFYVEPRNRAIVPLDRFHCSRSLAKVLRQERFTVTCDLAFERVIAACAEPRPDHPETWISRRIEASYCMLHNVGHAHSIEVWSDDDLVGGLYGVGFDGVFCGESMFSRVPNASKVALAWLVAAMRKARMRLLDCQFMTEHLESMGAVEVSQARYLALLGSAQGSRSSWAQAVGEEGLAEGLGVGAGALSLPEGFALLLEDGDATGASSPGKRIAQDLIQTS
ncbi:leucyl/phenylalanyl-tRNA--protein transferase [Altererythrobacter salegens]|uniref:Leucyl/phenylalanyl-tRNA--protein transferase n=1 Tax=Croceibacterium salegens TaxID=1737568 RepID=A0A6I4STV5_9SPHN|nr:leucyl/phenylalanyl-tRNA--protein transferase [Croceibacterium salegens]MXO58939.1 leucyl/phenylalanyl-tRNA--protein transferase [Croceibacterium salegens]